MSDFYEILGVDKTASQDEIKKAYRKMAHKYHPDKNQGDKVAESKFKEVNNAYETLGNQQKRQQYDRFGANYQNMGGMGAGSRGGGFGFDGVNFGGFQSGGFEDINDVFEQFFGGSSRRGSGNSRSKGVDIEMGLEITLEEAAKGISKEINYTRKVECDRCEGKGHEPDSKVQTCPTCKGRGRVYQRMETIFGTVQQETVCPTCEGTGKVYDKKCKKCNGKTFIEKQEKIQIDIPAGVSNGDRVRVPGKGQAGYKGTKPGDLFLRIKIKTHKYLTRESDNIISTIEVGYFDLLLGSTIDVYTVWGDLEVTIPAGTNPEGKLRLRGKGMPILNNQSRVGDHFLKIKVRMPKLSDKQKQVLENLRDGVA